MATHHNQSTTITARATRFPIPHQGTTPAANANEPISSESVSSSPEPVTVPTIGTSLFSDTSDLRTTTTPHMNRIPSPSHEHSGPGTAALSTPRRSTSLSIPRVQDMDHHHHHHHQHQHQHGQGRSRPTTLQRVATRFRSLTRSSDVPVASEEDWTVFGEAMAHEVQPQPPLPPPSPPPVVPVDEACRTSSIQRTQSPASDGHLEDFAPSVEERELEVSEEEQDEEGSSSLDTGLLGSHSHVDSSDTESTSLGSPKDTHQRGQSPHGGKARSSWWKRLLHLPTLPSLYRNILKCSLAYLLGSLFTYYSPLSRFISDLTQEDGPGQKYPSAMGHMVATV